MRLSRTELAKQRAVDEARKAGTLAPALDEEGNAINPHLPKYLVEAPWYAEQRVGLHHQRSSKPVAEQGGDLDKNAPLRGKAALVKRATPHVFLPGSCKNCGATTHRQADCLERPRRAGAWKTDEVTTQDDVRLPQSQSQSSRSYDEARDRYAGYDPTWQLKAVAEYNKAAKSQPSAPPPSSEEAASLTSKTEFKQSLRVRSDVAKYLYNLDLDSAYYDPKTRSMRGNPLPNLDPTQVTFAGDNFVRDGDDQEMKELEAAERFAARMAETTGIAAGTEGAAIADPIVNPTQLIKAKREFDAKRTNVDESARLEMLQAYGESEASVARAPPKSILRAADSTYVEWDAKTGLPVSAAPAAPSSAAPASEFEEDVWPGNHTSVYGSFFEPRSMRWGYACCCQLMRQSYCTGDEGKHAYLQSTPESMLKRHEAQAQQKRDAEAEAATTSTVADAPRESSEMSRKRRSRSVSSDSSRSSSHGGHRRHRHSRSERRESRDRSRRRSRSRDSSSRKDSSSRRRDRRDHDEGDSKRRRRDHDDRSDSRRRRERDEY